MEILQMKNLCFERQHLLQGFADDGHKIWIYNKKRGEEIYAYA